MTFDNVLGKQNRTFYMGVAMIWIIGYHLWLKDMAYYDRDFKIFSHIFKYGYVGVDIFFFLSAYGLCYSFMSGNIKQFYFKRFVRIVPVFLVYYIIRYLIEGGDFLQFCYFKLLQLSTLTIFPSICPKEISLDWFIPAMLNLYLVFPIIFKVVGYIVKRNRLWHLLSVLIAFYGSHFLWGYIDGLYITRIPIVIVGVFTYFYLKGNNYKNILLMYAIFAMQLFFLERHNLMYSAPVPIVLLAISNSGLNIARFSIISSIGNMSIEYFFSHVWALAWCKSDSLLVDYLVFFSVTIIFAYILHYINKTISNRCLNKTSS